MAKFQFQKATKTQARLRMALIGPSGSGKTYTSLRVGTALGRVALIDTERGSAAKYADRFHFDILQLEEFSPRNYVEAISAAEIAGYDVVVIDSLSHAWFAKGGALEMADNAAARDRGGNRFAAWREVTPQHNALVDAILRSRCHVIATMRVKTEYVVEQNEKGRSVPRKVGLAPIQRDGLEYEFDVVADMDLDNKLIVSKTRCSELKGAVIDEPGEGFAATLATWLSDGEPVETRSDEVANRIVQFALPGEMDAIVEEVSTLQDHLTELDFQLRAVGKSMQNVVDYYKVNDTDELTLEQVTEALATLARRKRG